MEPGHHGKAVRYPRARSDEVRRYLGRRQLLAAHHQVGGAVEHLEYRGLDAVAVAAEEDVPVLDVGEVEERFGRNAHFKEWGDLELGHHAHGHQPASEIEVDDRQQHGLGRSLHR